MIKWFKKRDQEIIVKKEEPPTEIETEVSIENMIKKWFNNMDLYFEVYGHGTRMQRKVHDDMDFRWGCYHFNGGAKYYSNGVQITCSKERYRPINYKMKISVIYGREICVWENGEWRHETPQEMKDEVEKHLLVIRQFNEKCENVDFTTLIEEARVEKERIAKEMEKEKEKEKEQEKERESERIKEEEKRKEEKFREEQELLMMHFGKQKEKTTPF